MMNILIFLFFVLFMSFLLWNIRVIYNFDPLENFSKTNTPLIKNGFDLAFMDQEKLYKYERDCAKIIQASYRRQFFSILTYVVIKAKDAAIILGSSKHINKSLFYDLLHPFLKTGLLTSGGDKWHTRRKMLTPAFHFNILKEFFLIFKEESDKLVVCLKEYCGKEVDISPILSKYSLNMICESAMGVKLSDLGTAGDVYRNKIYDLGRLIVHRIIKPWFHIDLIYSIFGYQKELDKVLKSIHSFTKSIIDKRKAEFNTRKKEELQLIKDENENIYFRSKRKRSAMMDTLLQAQSEGLIDDEGIIEETDTFTFEGHDTTSTAMIFILLLLAHHPEVQDKLYNEILEITNIGDELTIEQLNIMNYMEMVLKESLRLYPPVQFISRCLGEDVLIDEVLYKKDTIIELFICDIHRDPENFPDPEKFDPDRFLPENCEKRHNFAFLAFSAGMRNCIGQRFAMMQLKVMLAKIIKNFKVVPVTKIEELIIIADLILRTKNSIKIKFIERD